MNNLNKDIDDICIDFNNSKLIKINNNANSNEILKYLNNKLLCDDNKQVLKTIKKDNTFTKNMNELFITYNKDYKCSSNSEFLFNQESEFFPLLINNTKMYDSEDHILYNIDNIKYVGNLTKCSLCDIIHSSGYTIEDDDTQTKYLFGNKNPIDKETYLIYKDFIIGYNHAPYMSDHLMIMTLNHDNISGSQYEIINKEKLSNIIQFYNLISKEYFMGHNYVLTGSQTHFHIHLLKIQPNVNYGFDNFLNFLAISSLENKDLSISPRLCKIKEGHIDESSYIEYSNISNPHIRILDFKSLNYGYKGFLITTEKEYFNKNKLNQENFINTVYKFLNLVEDTILYTFTLYFGYSSTHLNIVVLPQKKKINKKGKVEVESFRNVIGTVYINDFYEITKETDFFNFKSKYIRYIRSNIYFIDEKIFTSSIFKKEEIINVIDKNIGNDNYMSNLNIRNMIQLSSSNKVIGGYINNFIENLKNKPINNNPKIIIINSPIGSGKSKLYENLNNYFSFYNKKDFVHINVDNIVIGIPYYKNKLLEISDYLKKYILKKPFNKYTNPILHRYNEKTVNDLKDDNFMINFDISHYKIMYDEIFDNIYPFTNEMTLRKYRKHIFEEISNERLNLEDNLIEICKFYKMNIVFEFARREFDDFIGAINILPILSNKKLDTSNVYYIGYNYDKIKSVSNLKKFILRNVMLRNIFEGRLIDYDTCLDNIYYFQEIQGTYIENIPKENLILLKNFYYNTELNLKSEDINNYKFVLFSNPNEFKIETHNYEIIDIEDLLKFKPKFHVLENNSKLYNYKCINDLFSINSKFSKFNILQNNFNKISNKYLLNETTKTIIINNLIENFNNIKKKLVENSKITGSILPKCEESDFDLVLTGDLNLKLMMKNILEIYTKNINFEKSNDKDKIKLNELLDDIDNNLNILKNSELTFEIIINKIKFKEVEYNLLKNTLEILMTRYLFYLKSIIDIDDFFGYDFNYDFITKKIDFDNSVKSIDKFPRFSEIITRGNKIGITGVFSDKKFNILINTPINDTDKIISNPITSNYFINLDNSNNDITNISLKNSYLFIFKDKSSKNITSTILNLKIKNFSTSIKIKKNDLFNINYTNNLFNLNFKMFSTKNLIKNLKNYINSTLYPWLNNDYDSFLEKYILLLFINKLFELVNSYSYKNYKLINNQIKEDLTEYLDLTKNLELPSNHIYYDLILDINSYKKQISMITDNLILYKKLFAKFNLIHSDIDFSTHKNDMIRNFNIYIEKIKVIISKYSNIFSLFHKYLNDDICSKLQFFYENKLELVQWAGYKDLYKSFKKYYLELKGGALQINKNSIVGFNHYYEDFQTKFLKYLCNYIIPNLQVDGHNFTTTDISEITPISCINNECIFRISNSGNNKYYLFKVMGATNSKNVYFFSNNFNNFLKNANIGYYNYNTKNKILYNTIAYLYSDKNKIFFNSINSEIKYIGDDNYENSNIFIIIMECGIHNLKFLKKQIDVQIKDMPLVNRKIYNKEILDNLYILIKTFIDGIKNLQEFDKINNKYIYITHNSIKNSNIYYNIEYESSKQMLFNITSKIIYLDTIKYSENFFINTEEIDYIENFLINNDLYTDDNIPFINSPLTDIGAIVLTFIRLFIPGWDGDETSDNLFISLKNLKNLYSEVNLFSKKIEINEEIEKLSKELINKINDNFFDSFYDLPDDDIDILKFTKQMIIYINLFLSINRFYYMNKDILNTNSKKNTLNNLIFKNFELIKLNLKTEFPTFDSIKRYDNSLRNKDLLDNIIDDTNYLIDNM